MALCSQALLLTVLLLAVSCEWIEQVSSFNDQIMAYRRFVKDNNEKRISEFNAQRKGQTLWANPDFIHYTEEEIREIYGNKQMRAGVVDGVQFKVEAGNRVYPKPAQLLSDFTNRIVNNSLETGPAKHQGQCGGCYSFAANNVVNYAFNKYYRPTNASLPASLKLASEQEIIECSRQNLGCDGGWPHLAMIYIKRNDIHTDKHYKYRAETFYSGNRKQCEFIKNRSFKNGKEINIDKNVVRAREMNTIVSLITIIDIYKVAAIAVYSLHFNFLYYKAGVISECGRGEVDHAVTLVGYTINHEAGLYVWIVKNSWGVRWGIGGYSLISMDNNTCGVLTYASYLSPI